ncbi:MAG: efflux RND transporter periplasmic adaptor subunit [Pseudomonadales bacterium]|jgi:RND family efflux transporter MFP subunit|nr:efflux RND transporter periplasmic adaptor subunit [Pseudomonadales bacterium]
MIRVVLIPLAIVALSILGAITLYATAPELEPESPAPIAPAVRVVTVRPDAVQHIVHSQGTVEPRTESELIPEVAGRVEWVSPALVSGGVFDADAPLLRIEQADYEAALAQARAAAEQAEAEEENARFEFERLQQLQDRSLASRSQLEAAERRLRVAEAGLSGARSGLERARRDLERTELRAPFVGMVRTESVDVGQFVNRGNAVATIYATDFVEIRLPIADEQLAYLNLPLGMRGELSPEAAPDVELAARFAGRDYRWRGDVVRTEGEIDPRSRMVHVVARVASADPPLPVGLFVQARIEGARVADVVTLPRAALRDGNRVLIVDAENRMHYRDIVPLRFYQDQVMVAEGLAAGDRVCVSPIQTVVEGMTVDPVVDAAPASAS